MWELDNPEQCATLLPTLVKPSGFDNTVVVIAVDMSAPWTIMNSLKAWVSALQSVVVKVRHPLVADRFRIRSAAAAWCCWCACVYLGVQASEEEKLKTLKEKSE